MSTFKFSNGFDQVGFAAMVRRMADAIEAGEAMWEEVEIKIPKPVAFREASEHAYSQAAEPCTLTITVKASRLVMNKVRPEQSTAIGFTKYLPSHER